MIFRFDARASLARARVAREGSPTVPILPVVSVLATVKAPTVGSVGTVGRGHEAKCAAFEERAAIVEFDAGLSRTAAEDGAAREEGHADAVSFHRWLASEYERGLRSLQTTNLCPSGRAFVETALEFVGSGWAERALAVGWGPHELLRADEDRPWDRLDRLGAAYLANDPIGVTADYIELEPVRREPRRVGRWRGDGKGCWPWHALRVVGGAEHG